MRKKVIVYNGGLGNQLFQFSYMYYLKKIEKKEVEYNISLYDKYKIHSGFQADKIFDFSGFSKNTYDYNLRYSVNKKLEGVFNKSILFNSEGKENNNKPLIGYWQDVFFYKMIKHDLTKLILDLDKYCSDEALKKKIELNDSVFIHIRRGDYCNNSMYYDLSQTDYYFKAIEMMQMSLANPRFYVFSDDINWSKKYFEAYLNFCYVEYDNQSALGDLSLMLHCKNAIIANSSFSWWGAALDSKNIVIHPDRYYTKKECHNLYDAEWIGI